MIWALCHNFALMQPESLRLRGTSLNEPTTANEVVRRQLRLSLDISVRVVTEQGVSSFARAHDFSPSGMSFYAGVELASGAKVRVQFQLPNSRVKLDVAGVVRNRNSFRYGIEFVHLSSDEAAEISRVFSILALTQL